MSVTRHTEITQVALDALAELANTKLASFIPANIPGDYEFTYFDDTLLPPTAVQGVVNYGSGDYVGTDGILTVRVHSFKEVSGRRHYSKRYATGSVTFNGSGDPANIDWTWTPPGGSPDGYIVLLEGTVIYKGSNFGFWQEVASAGFNSTGFDWLDPEDSFSDPNPVSSGPWRRELERIRKELFDLVDGSHLTRDETWLVSGPWCVATGPRLRNGSNLPNYTEIEFYYALADHAGDVPVTTEAEIGSVEVPLSFTNELGGSPRPDWRVALDYNCPDAAEVRGTMVWSQTGSGSGWTHSLTVTSGAASIIAETWLEVGDTLTLEFSALLPAGNSSLRVDVTTAAGNIVGGGGGVGTLVSVVEVATVTLTPSAVPALHPSSAARKVICPDMDLALGPVFFKAGEYHLSLHAAEIAGVWVAQTLPVFGVNPYVDMDLPNYPGAIAVNDSVPSAFQPGPRAGAPDWVEYLLGDQTRVVPVEPAVNGRPALWPVFRDTDYLTWKLFGGREAPVPFFPGFNDFERHTVTLAAGADWSRSLFLPDNHVQTKIETVGASLPIYFSATVTPDPDDAGTYDGVVTGTLRMPDDFAPPVGQNMHYTIRNDTAGPVSFVVQIGLFADGTTYHPGDAPEFFLRDPEGRGVMELYSHNFSDSTRIFGGIGGVNARPLSGYCLYELEVRRVATGSGIRREPTDQPELAVRIGMMWGTTIEAAGTFTELTTVTIPANAPRVTVPVFWPVLGGTPLVYQATSAVNILAHVNFQPAFVVHFHPTRLQQNGALANVGVPIYGAYCGTPSFQPSRLLRFKNNVFGDEHYVGFPVAAVAYNDLEAILNLL